MKPETVFAALCVLFGIGLTLVAVGLGAPSKPAAVGCGVVLCLAATKLLSGGFGNE